MQGNLTNPTSPYSSINTASLTFPSFSAPSDGMCNSDLPNDSTLNRYLYVIQYYIQQVTHMAAHALPLQQAILPMCCQLFCACMFLHGAAVLFYCFFSSTGAEQYK